MKSADLTHYRRNLPHRLPPGEHLFITFRLAGSLPQAVLEQWRSEWQRQDQQRPVRGDRYSEQKRYFGRFDALLDGSAHGPHWLGEPAVAGVIGESLHYYNGKNYELICYCLMSNHVHLVVGLPDNAPPLARTLQYLKGYTAQKANALLGRNGQFWHRESYDHVVRDAGEMVRVISYVLENPVKAGLVAEWQQWPYSYWRDV